MPRRRNNINAINSKLTSRRMRSATLGTHVQKLRPEHMNADRVGFSSPRRQKRAQRGYVNNVMPAATGPVGRAGNAGRLEFSPGVKRRSVARRAGIVLAVVAVLAAVAIGVGSFTLFGSLDSKLELSDSDAKSALATAKSGEAFYTLVAADLDLAGMPYSEDGPDALALVRTDAQSNTVTVLAIPASVQVSLKDGKYHPLREASTQDGDAALISAVNSLCGVQVNHFVKIDAQGIVALVDALGGVDVNLSEEVDDPRAGDVYLPAGEQTLSGAAALTLARAANYQSPTSTQASFREQLLTQVSLAMLGSGKTALVSLLDKVGGTFGTDVSSSDMLALADSLKGISAANVKAALIPGYVSDDGGTSVYTVSTSKLASMMERVEAGEDPAVSEEVATVDPASFTLTIRNGSGITGAAASMTSALNAKGFEVSETGNTDTAAYNETLVIYDDDDQLDQANTAIAAMGVGRAVQNTGSYTYNTDVLVILGKDWKPSA